MINNLRIPNIRLFVFGTLCVGNELAYYMEGSSALGRYYTQGQLMESATGSAYINFDVQDASTIGELHHVNYYCLQRINHLEISTGEFPKRYHLDLVPVWPYEDISMLNNFNEDRKALAFCYKLREATKVIGGDWMKRKDPLEEIGRFLKNETEQTLYYNDVIKHIVKYLTY